MEVRSSEVYSEVYLYNCILRSHVLTLLMGINGNNVIHRNTRVWYAIALIVWIKTNYGDFCEEIQVNRWNWRYLEKNHQYDYGNIST